MDVTSSVVGGSAITLQDFEGAVASRTLTVGVVGLGATGLPLALAYARAGFRVVGYDVDRAKVAMLQEGVSYLAEVDSSNLTGVSRSFSPTDDSALLRECDATFVCVPTPLTDTGRADLRFIARAFDMAESLVRPGSLLVLQSTVPPGTTAASAQRLARNTGLELGTELFVAMAPERIDPANKGGWTIANTPRLVGGVTPECARRAAVVMSVVCDRVVEVSATAVAEAAKVFENTFRLVNIALTYELEAVCGDLGISAHEVVAAAATKPFGFLPHWPGPGVGGECIPVDPLFLVELTERRGIDLPLIRNAYSHIMDRPRVVVEQLARVVKERGRDLSGSRVLVAGVSYKPDVADTRNAPSRDIVRELWMNGAVVSYADPFVPEFEVDGEKVPRVRWERAAMAAHDCVVLVTPHSEFLQRAVWSGARHVVDVTHSLPSSDVVDVL